MTTDSNELLLSQKGENAMMKVNDFQKYEVTLSISYEDYFRLIYDTKYLIEARLGPDRTFIARKSVYGNSRKKAVQKAVQWFWKDFKGVLGPAHKVMTVNDPFDEVNYHDGFACNDLANKYLEEGTIVRVLEEAKGDLARDESEGSENHPPNSLKRIRKTQKGRRQLPLAFFKLPVEAYITKSPQFLRARSGRARDKIRKAFLKSLEGSSRGVSRPAWTKVCIWQNQASELVPCPSKPLDLP